MAHRLESAGRQSLPSEMCKDLSMGTTSAAAKIQSSSSPPLLCGTQCRFRPSIGIHCLTTAARSCQDSLGAKVPCYFCTWSFTGVCSRFCYGLLSPEGCCDLLQSWANVPQICSLAFQELLLPVATPVFSALLAREHLYLPKINIIPE